MFWRFFTKKHQVTLLYTKMFAAPQMEKLFGLVDYLVLASLLLVSSMIGVYFRLTGGRKLFY
jgi:hypothetical protein